MSAPQIPPWRPPTCPVPKLMYCNSFTCSLPFWRVSIKSCLGMLAMQTASLKAGLEGVHVKRVLPLSRRASRYHWPAVHLGDLKWFPAAGRVHDSSTNFGTEDRQQNSKNQEKICVNVHAQNLEPIRATLILHGKHKGRASYYIQGAQ